MDRVVPAFINDPLVGGFRPIPALNRTDADVTLLILHNRAMYTNPVNDPFFKSTTHRQDYSASFFTSDLDIGMLGCTEQYQFCNGPEKCSELAAWSTSSSTSVVDNLDYNVAQRAL